MVIEIALGIVLAVIILNCLPLIIIGGAFLLGIGLLIGAVALGVAFWPKLLILPPLIVGYAVPYAIYMWVSRRFAWFQLALDGKPPYDGWWQVPVRFAIAAPIVLSLVALGFAIAGGGLALLEPFYEGARG